MEAIRSRWYRFLNRKLIDLQKNLWNPRSHCRRFDLSVRLPALLQNVTCHVTTQTRDKELSAQGLKRLFGTGDRRGVDGELADRLRRQLDVLNRARSTRDMNLPGYRLHQLKGNRAGTWSVTVSGNWRVTFTFEGEDAYDVDLEDYH